MKKTAAKDRKRLRPAAVLVLSMALLLPGVGEASRTLPPAFGAKVVPEITAAELLNFSRPDAPEACRFTLLSAENSLSFAALSVVGSADTACFSAPSHFKLFDLPSPIDRLSSLELDQKTAYRRFFEPTERIYRQTLTLSEISHQGVYFLQPDPLGPVDSPNLYQGFGFDALNVTDPYGECWLTGDDVPCSDYAKEIGRTFFSSSPKASIAGAKATGRFLKHEAIGTGKFVISAAKLGWQVVRHPIRSVQAAGHAAVDFSEGFRALVDTVTMDPVEALKEAGSSFANADPDAVAEGVGGTLASVVAFEAGARAVSALRGTLVEGVAPAKGAVRVNLLDPAPASVSGGSLIELDPVRYAHGRSMALQELLPAGSRGRVTMSAAVVEDAQGVRRVLIGTSEPGGYLRPGLKSALKPSETLVPGLRHAEQDLVLYAEQQGYRVIAVGAGRAHCPTCVDVIESVGGITASPRRGP